MSGPLIRLIRLIARKGQRGDTRGCSAGHPMNTMDAIASMALVVLNASEDPQGATRERGLSPLGGLTGMAEGATLDFCGEIMRAVVAAPPRP